jgi:hypothetical protein
LSFDEEKESAKRAKDVTIRMMDAGDLLTAFARAARYAPTATFNLEQFVPKLLQG